MMAYKDLKVGMEVEALTVGGDWLPARVTELTRRTWGMVWVVFLTPGYSREAILKIIENQLRPKPEGGGTHEHART